MADLSQFLISAISESITLESVQKISGTITSSGLTINPASGCFLALSINKAFSNHTLRITVGGTQVYQSNSTDVLSINGGGAEFRNNTFVVGKTGESITLTNVENVTSFDIPNILVYTYRLRVL